MQRLHVYAAQTVLMARRRRNKPHAKPRAAQASKPDRMARVAVADDVWADFRALAEPDTISVALGRLVAREVDRHHAHRLKTQAQFDDQQLTDALDRARELHDQLTQIVDRLERRLDRQAATRVDPGR